jgi:hypothetical protein
MNNGMGKFLAFCALVAGTAAYFAVETVRCLWVHRFPTTTEVLIGVCLVFATRLYFLEND